MEKVLQNSDIEYTMAGMKQLFSSSSDVNIKTMKKDDSKETFLLVYCGPLIDSVFLNEVVLPKVNQHLLGETLENISSMIQVQKKR